MAGSQLEQAIATFREQLLAYDGRALGAVLATYEPIRQNLIAQIGQLLDLAAANPGADLWQLTRAQDLLVQIQAEMATLTAKIGPLVATAQAVVINEAGDYQQQLAVLSATTPALAAEINATWNALPTSALADLVGRLSDGSPLNDWLAKFGDETAQSLKESLTEGLALGLHPSVVAAQMAAQTDVAGSRLAALTRTTMLSAFRSSSLAQYAENADILSGWVWFAELDGCCAACAFLHGTFHPLSEDFFPSHVNCRCTSLPLIKGMDNEFAGAGEKWFMEQPASYQDQILGAAGGAALRDGDVTLQDFLHRDDDPRWGPAYRQSSTAQALASANQGG